MRDFNLNIHIGSDIEMLPKTTSFLEFVQTDWSIYRDHPQI